ncbi:hypothetical protein BOX15_Mlig032250g2 [Macrostomum lignano]|uniref:PX domain-containing protein kinase-like protein n=2 Tax=Macrostomum lignano TaxID=282301 RepID=A0A1I8IPQ2_9PLAT|nr:hypothetical protein BOX15_Mlig032250g2 [Macrostomum lignano]
MALFSASESKILDDYYKLTVSIEGSQDLKEYVEYILKVNRGDSDSWKVYRRYNDFVSLDNVLKISGYELPLPPKKWVGNKGREFVATRQKELQNYVNVLLSIPLLEQSFPVKQFLDPDNYCFNYQELSLQHVSMVLRSESTFQVLQPCSFMGTRIRKTYFTAESALPTDRNEYLMTWVGYGPFCNLDQKDTAAVVSCLTSISHPFIANANICGAVKHGFYCVRQFERHGSVRDLLHKAKPKLDCLKKYGRQKGASSSSGGLSVPQIQSFGRQILEALKFMHSKGFAYGHLHLGNVLVSENGCKLTDLENGLLGLSCSLRQRVLSLKRLKSFEEIDVYSFGHCLYEMATGQVLTSSYVDTHSLTCSTDLKNIIQSILTEDAIRSGMPTVPELLENPFFASTPVHYLAKPQWKIAGRAKEVLTAYKAAQEFRLREDQRQVSLVKRRSRAANLTEDERRARRTAKFSSADGDATKVNPSAQQQQQQPPPPPPPGVPPPPPPPMPPSGDPGAAGGGQGRGALLSDIAGFRKDGLKKAVTNDRSQPSV